MKTTDHCYHSVNVITFFWPKVITLSGFHCGTLLSWYTFNVVHLYRGTLLSWQISNSQHFEPKMKRPSQILTKLSMPKPVKRTVKVFFESCSPVCLP